MAFQIPNLGEASYEDQAFPNSTDIDVLVNGFTGDGIVSGCDVTAQGSPDMSVHVASGTAYFDGSSVAVSSADPSITAAASNPRRDLVYVTSGGSVGVAAGTPQAPDPTDPSVVPVLPAVPADSVALAAVDVPANATAITTGMIVDKRIGSVGEFAVGLAVGPTDLSYYRQVGTSPLESWHPAGITPVTTVASYGNLGNGTLWAMPYLESRGGTIDRLAFLLSTTAPGYYVRLGIYEATSATNLYPGDLLLDSGAIELTPSGVLAWSGTQALANNTLYWLTMLANSSSATFGNHSTTSAQVTAPVLGVDSTLNVATKPCLSVAQAYGALPDPFPSSAARSVYLPLIAVRYSA